MKLFSVLALVTVAACGLQFRTSISTGPIRGGPSRKAFGADGAALPTSTSFALAVDGPIQLQSRFGGAPGSKSVAVCEWQNASALRAHLGGGRYGNMGIAFDYKFPEDEKGPCDDLAAKAPPERELLGVAQRSLKCPGCVRAARWMVDDWSVQSSAEGNPIQMVRAARVLVVIRKGGTTRDVPPLEVAVVTSDEMKKRIANVCRFPPMGTSCSVDSAAVHHAVHFFDDDDEKLPVYEVMTDIHVKLGGAPGICEMRVVVTNQEGVLKLGEGQCRNKVESDSMYTWDSRCFTAGCIETTAKSRAR